VYVWRGAPDIEQSDGDTARRACGGDNQALLAWIELTEGLASLQARGQRRVLAQVFDPQAPSWGKANVARIRKRLAQRRA
jgi:hypothetical protein